MIRTDASTWVEPSNSLNADGLGAQTAEDKLDAIVKALDGLVAGAEELRKRGDAIELARSGRRLESRE